MYLSGLYLGRDEGDWGLKLQAASLSLRALGPAGPAESSAAEEASWRLHQPAYPCLGCTSPSRVLYEYTCQAGPHIFFSLFAHDVVASSLVRAVQWITKPDT